MSEHIDCACGVSTTRADIDAAYRAGDGGWCWSIHVGWRCPRCVSKRLVAQVLAADRVVRDAPRSGVDEQHSRAWRVSGSLKR